MAPPKMLWSDLIHICRYIIAAKVGVPPLCLHPVTLLLAPLKDSRNRDSMPADRAVRVLCFNPFFAKYLDNRMETWFIRFISAIDMVNGTLIVTLL